MLADWRTAPVDERLRATLGFLEKLTLWPAEVGPDDVLSLRAQRVRTPAIVDAIYVCALFNTLNRVSDALGFEIPRASDLARSWRVMGKFDALRRLTASRK